MSGHEKSCFIITPIGEENSEIRRKADGVIKSAIKPVLDNNDYIDVKAAHEITTIGSINNQVITRIANDDLVIANLTGLNPNVMYELAIRHATMKPVIHICEYGTILPFDIKDQRTIFYSNDMLGVLELSVRLNDIIEQIDENDKFEDNPIYNAIKTSKILQDITTDEPIKYLISKVEELANKIDKPNKIKLNRETQIHDQSSFLSDNIESEQKQRSKNMFDDINDIINNSTIAGKTKIE